MKKMFSSLLSAVALFGACFFSCGVHASSGKAYYPPHVFNQFGGLLGFRSDNVDGADLSSPSTLSTQPAAAATAAATAPAAATAAATASAPGVSAVRDTELVFIIDKSGSMRSLSWDTVMNFNRLIDEQRADTEHGEVFVTTVMFNQVYETIHDRVNIRDMGHITVDTYNPRGWTAMRDAVGDTLKKLATQNDVVGHKVIVVIMTDGKDNCSQDYSAKDIRRMIAERKAIGWQFLFFGANIDVQREADSIGVDYNDTVVFNTSSAGLTDAFNTMSIKINLSRTSNSSIDPANPPA